MSRATRINLGLLALVIAAALFVAGEFVLARGDLLMNPAADPTAFAEMVTGAGFAFYAGRGLIGAFLEAFGMIALYMYLEETPVERLAFWGMTTSILGDIAGGAFFGSMLLVYPKIAATAPEAVGALSISPVLLGVMFIVTLVGLALFAVAIWQSPSLPRWSGVIMFAGFLLLIIQVFAVQIAGNVLWGLGALWIYLEADPATSTG